jgi:shikimate dehydrogenase
MTRITGQTRVLFILGDPVGHILGSALLNEHFAGRGIDAAVSPLHVRPADLPVVVDTLRRLHNVPGFGVTIPHKIAVLPLLDEVGPRARLVGAVNFVRRSPDGHLYGDNVDGTGFVAGLAQSGIDVKGARVLQAGAGGAGRAIAFAMAEAGAAALTVTNRTAERARTLADAVASAFPACQVGVEPGEPSRYDIAVNTTSLGMKPGDALPIDPRQLRPDCVAAEVIMKPEVTPFLDEAARRGCRVVRGKAMLLAQLEHATALVGLG